MLSFVFENQRFQLRAAAVIVHDGHVLLHRADSDTYWSLPGGRVEFGEDAAATLVREMKEELSEEVECGRLLYVVENFFEHESKKNHEVGLYLTAALRPKSHILNKEQTHLGTEATCKLEFRWFPKDQLSALDIRPLFLREALGATPNFEVEHFIQRG